MKRNSFVRQLTLLSVIIISVWNCKTDKEQPTPVINNGNTGSSNGSSNGTGADQTGTATFYTKQDLGVGPITVYVDGKLEGTISHYHTNGVTCGQGDVNVIKSAGTYSMKATGGSQVWNGSITIKNGVCISQEFIKNNSTDGSGTGSGSGVTATCDFTAWNKLVEITRYEYKATGGCSSPSGETNLSIKNNATVLMDAKFCMQQPDGKWSCGAWDNVKPGGLFANNYWICGKSQALKIWAKPSSVGNKCPFPAP
ncbi:hypothetical protein [Spirosoma linguale]|uniref:Uncharacterized protein n=1 Tax=Spirosoma linguale (strain ATCC 33905 / DSM 74 / LMG 10896 / Claus 1) TaxID=504472 RepID=D2QQM6_SPILD|nr:hypothetical protein Slin_4829 [Spirosoma linguale DSM 74]